MAHDDAREGRCRGNWRMEWVASTDHLVASTLTPPRNLVYPAYYRWCAHLGCQQSTELKPCRFKWTRPFRRETKSGDRACAITFQTQPNDLSSPVSCAGTVRQLKRHTWITFIFWSLAYDTVQIGSCLSTM